MFERFDDEARAVGVQAQIHARKLGHRYLGCEHLLLALTSSGTDLSQVLGASGLTPASVEAATLRVLGTPGPPDHEALAAIGIDLDQVRATRGQLWSRRVARHAKPWPSPPLGPEPPLPRRHRSHAVHRAGQALP